MRILITNNSLDNRAGSELYARDLAIELLRRGHTPVCFSTLHGEVARDLRLATVPVIQSLSQLTEPPDVIHGQHHLETMAALAHFPGVPAVYVCHGWLPFVEKPPRHPRITRYVAVDDLVRERLILEEGIEASRTRMILGFVDTRRFRPTRALPQRPQRALIFSNQASDETFVPPIRAACESRGISLDVVGLASGRSAMRPERILPGYDIVFAKARGALEALASGCAVILCDAVGAGPMVRSDEVARLRQLNFGFRAIQNEPASEWFEQQIDAYDAADAGIVTEYVRREADIAAVVGSFVELYESAIDAAPASSPAEDGQAISAYLEMWGGQFKREALKTLESPDVLRQQVTKRFDRSVESSDPDPVEVARSLKRLRELENSPLIKFRNWLHRRRGLVSLYSSLTAAFRRH